MQSLVAAATKHNGCPSLNLYNDIGHPQASSTKQSEKDEHNDHHRMMIADFQQRIWISLAFTIPILLLSPMIQMAMGISFHFFGHRFVLLSLAISVAYFYSAAVTFGIAGETFFWELATLIDIMLLGHWIETKSVLGASRALKLLVQLMPAMAHRTHNEQIEDVPLETLVTGDLVDIKPGEKVPADGVVTEGESSEPGVFKGKGNLPATSSHF